MTKMKVLVQARRISGRRMAATGLILGGGVFAWQVYHLGKPHWIGSKNSINSSKMMKKQRDHRATNEDFSEPEYLTLSPHLSQRLEPIGAKEDLKSIFHPKHLRKPWKLLRQANWGDYEKHLLAVRELASLRLSDGESQQIAQSCSMRTTIGLARCKDVSLKFFLSPPPLPKEIRDTSTVKLFRHILSELPMVEGNMSIKFFTTEALENYVPGTDEEMIADTDIQSGFNAHDLSHLRPRQRYSEKKFVEFCLQALLSHSTVQENCDVMIKQKVLPFLAKIVEEHPHNPMVKSLVGKILANMAVHLNTHYPIFVSGWVGILAHWKQDPNLLVNLPAIKALCNLDQIFGGEVFQPGIYQLLPENRNVKHLNELSNWGVDVVFIHGILGGVFYSWRQLDTDNSRGWGSAELISSDDYSFCWPRDWLANLSDHVRVIGVDFDTSLSLWTNKVSSESYKTSLKDRGKEIMGKLQASGVGDRPVIFVGHSMGGLIIKQMLKYASESSDSADRNFLKNTKGIVFYSTPHQGSRFATLNPYSKYFFFPTTEVEDLEFESPHLLELHQHFKDIVQKHKDMEVISFGETVPTPYLGLDLTFVPSESSNPGVGEFYDIKTNHMNICKPANQRSILFRKFYKLLWDTIDATTPFE